ncbi:MAG: NAD(P)-dependent oxidoreductase [Bacteroidales bacterium]|jgi:nucleoside-diphosphate-sugar epimerase|nr:NAD(P)-dependent oxidoreductase [Bacteroidales bacterium]
MNRILLTGASGAVGREVLLQLCESQDEFDITVFDLKTKGSESFYKKIKSKFNLIYGNISVKDEICAVCRNKDVIIHLAAIIPPLADKNPKLAEAVNIEGTRNLVECAEELSPDAFFIYSSSISVYGNRNKDPLIRTGDNLVPSERDEYAKTKIEAEKIITGSGLRWTIFRLTAIMGTDNHKVSPLMFHMPLDTNMEIATPEDTGRAFINALRHTGKLRGNIYNLGGGEKCRISYRDFLSRSFKAMGLGSPDFHSNAFASKNFHCGYYADGDILEELLHFRKDTIDDYFIVLRKSISPAGKLFTSIFRKIIKKHLERQSEPLAAIRKNNTIDIQHYF